MPGPFAAHASAPKGSPVGPGGGPTPVAGMFDGMPPIFELPYTLRGVSRDASGNPLGSCAVTVVRVADGSIAALGTTDPTTGAYRFDASPSIVHQVQMYKTGTPDLVGASVNTLVGTPD